MKTVVWASNLLDVAPNFWETPNHHELSTTKDTEKVRLEQMPNGLISGAELLSLISSGRVFGPGTAVLHPTSSPCYDLRLANDMAIIIRASSDQSPGEHNSELPYTIYSEGSGFTGDLTLGPGDTALVSSVETMQFEWNVMATLGAKFNQSIKGLLVLTGSAIDPGYGRVLADGHWVPKAPPERVYFWIANISLKTISLRHFDRIARLQFFACEEADDQFKTALQNSCHDNFANVVRELKQVGVESAPGMGLFAQPKRITGQFQELSSKVSLAERRIETSTATTYYLGVFGVFLIVATLLGVAVSSVLSLASRFPRNAPIYFAVIACVGLAALLSLFIVVTIMAIKHLRSIRDP